MHPILIKIGPLKIYTYGVLVAIGFYIGVLVLYKNSALFNIKRKQIDDFIPWIIVSGLVGSRIFYFLFWDISYFLSKPWELFFVWKGGLSIIGSITGGLIGTILYCKKKEINIKDFLDLIVTGLPLSQSIGRLGCTMAGCCYGKETNFFLHIVFKNRDSLAPLFLPLHPTQIYESLLNLMIFFYINSKKKSQKFQGQLFLSYLFLYSFVRFFLEFIRGDTVYFPFINFLSKMQILCIIIIIFVFFIRLKWKKEKVLK